MAKVNGIDLTFKTIPETTHKAIIDGDEVIPFAGPDGKFYNITRDELFAQLGGIVSGFQGELAISDTPTEDGMYIPTESGVYSNAGGIEVDLSAGITFIVKNGPDFSEIVYPVDLSSVSVYPDNITSDLLDKIGTDFLSYKNLIVKSPYFEWYARLNNNPSSIAPDYYRVNRDLDVEVYATHSSQFVFTKDDLELDTSKPIEVSFEFDLVNGMNRGFMAGWSTSNAPSGNDRFVVGYEPVHNAIEIYAETFGFQKIIDNPASGHYKISIVYFSSTSVVINVNGVNYQAAEYGPINVIPKYFRVHSKISTLGMDVTNFFGGYYTGAPIDNRTKRYSSEGSVPGKNLHIYRFGGKGNDWCFVRTPDNYDPSGSPCPLVIASHGNGWVMDGSEQFANWTKRTMYVLDTDPDYIANPTQYNAVPPGSPLLYSNPTIEALLAAGYIVAGCQNYGDNLYGNTNCRNALQDFYLHMVRNYNVDEKIFMIGASNGAMSTLNAIHLMGIGKVRAVILQYPLTCLWRQYNGHPPHQAAIESAYGISPGLTESQFESATRTHDPEKVSTVVIDSKRIKTIGMPPIKLWYSNSDTTTAAVNNAIPFMQLLEDSGCEVESVIATGGHGDYTHFDPDAFVDFFDKYR